LSAQPVIWDDAIDYQNTLGWFHLRDHGHTWLELVRAGLQALDLAT
jgi:hypothetical protein